MNPAMELSLIELLPTKLKDAISDRLIERKHVTLGTVIGQGKYLAWYWMSTALAVPDIEELEISVFFL